MTLLGPLVPGRIKRLLTEHANLQDRVRDLERHLAALEADLQRQDERIKEMPLQPPGHAIINDHERKVFSQNGEDGILEFIFQRIGTTNKTFVEFGIQDGRECNTANLSINGDWSGLLMECDEDFVEQARAYYAEKLGGEADRVRIRQATVTAENIDQLLTEEGLAGPIDLISIDVDGSDLWIWEAITVVQPRVAVLEYNASFGPTRSVSVPYDPDFAVYEKHPSAFYHGASLTALAKRCRQRGYLLAGCDSRGVNAFFVDARAEAGSGLGELAPAAAFYPNSGRGILSQDEQFELFKGLDLVEI